MVSFFSGIVDGCDRVHPGGYPGPLREVLGLRVAEFWPLAEGRSVALAGRYAGRADLWAEEIVPQGARVVASFVDGELAGRPAVTRHDHGRGTAWYVGTRPEPALLRALLDDVRAAAGVAPVLPGLPAGVQAAVREGAGGRYLFLLNHGSRAVQVALPEPWRDALAPRAAAVTRVALAARGVAVLTGPAGAGGGGGAGAGGAG